MAKKKKVLGITKISKTQAKRLGVKSGYVIAFGTRTKPTLGRSRFKTLKKAKAKAQKLIK